MTEPVRSVAIVGRDVAAWIAAASIRRAFGGASVDVRVVELPTLLQSMDVYAAVPSIRGLHRLLGLNESIVVQHCDAVPMVGQRFSNWSQAAPPFLHAFESDPPPGGDFSFIQYWLKGRLEGLKVDLSDFGVGTAAASQSRVPVDAQEADPALSAGFGYHLDARAYANLIKRYALHNGVTALRTLKVDVISDGSAIEAVVTDDGTRVEADLFLDASGTEAVLLGKLNGAEFESWRRWFPADRLLAASAPPLKELPSFSQISAIREGWIGLFPLRSRTAVTAVYDSSLISDTDLAASIPVVARMPIANDAVVSPIVAGMQARPWIGNCVAIGEAAVTAEPLDAVQIHLVHAFTSHLVSLFPATVGSMPEAGAFNAAVRRLAENVRDFQMAHYKLNRRFDDAFWNRARDADAPSSLQRKLSLFGLRGIVPLNDDESFSEWNWAQSFLGHGLIPGGYDVRIDRVPDEDHVMKVQKRMRDVAELVRRMPTVGQFLSSTEASSAENVRA